MKTTILIVLQVLLLIFIIFISGPYFVFSPPFIIIQIISLLFIAWAVLVRWIYGKKPEHSFSKTIYFIKEGPYEFIRHPMYAGLLLLAASYMQEYLTFSRSIAFILFALILVMRIIEDEHLTLAHFKQKYKDYQKKTKKLIPYVY